MSTLDDVTALAIVGVIAIGGYEVYKYLNPTTADQFATSLPVSQTATQSYNDFITAAQDRIQNGLGQIINIGGWNITTVPIGVGIL